MMPAHIGKTLGEFGRARHLVLLISLLLLFLVSPFVVSVRYGTVIITIASAIVMVSGTYAVSERRRFFVVTLVVAAAAVATNWLMVALQREWIAVASHGLTLLLLGLFAVGILGDVLHGGRISADKIYGAICVYFLVGFAWTFGYAIMELINPGSFSGLVDTDRADYVGQVLQMSYFSFATLTTLGYGDIVPRSPAARTLATLEAAMGQVYLAVLIARLVGLHIVHSSRNGD